MHLSSIWYMNTEVHVSWVVWEMKTRKIIYGRISWRAFLSSSCVIFIGRFWSEFIFNDYIQDLYRQGHFLFSNTNHRHANKLKLNLSFDVQHSHPGCEIEQFGYFGMDFFLGDLPGEPSWRTAASAYECCAWCKITAECTHWTFLADRCDCFLKQGEPQRMQVSGMDRNRISFSSWIHEHMNLGKNQNFLGNV